MTQALVAVFDKQAQAQQARDALLGEGFLNDNMQLASAESMGGTAGEHQQHDESFGDKVKDFFGFGKHDEADTYSEAVKRGNCVLTIDVANDDEAKRAEDIMEKHDPIDIDEREAQWRESGWQGSQASSQSSGGQNGGEQVVPIVEEEIQVGKRETKRGGVRVRSHNYEKPVEQSVNLREQHTEVSSRAADRPATEADKAFGEVNFESRDTAEEAVVAKEARVVEEVVIGQKSSDRTETIKDSVRRTDVDVEKLDDDNRTTSSDNKRKTR